IKFADARQRLQLYGVNSAYQDVFNHWVDRGRFFTPLEDETKKRICVLGVSAAEKVNLGNDPIGKLIQIDGNGFTVVGMMEKKGGSFGRDQDDIVLIPFATASTIWGADNMKRLILAFQIRNGADLDLVKEQVTEVLRTRHHLK